MSAAFERKRLPVLPIDIIHAIVDVLTLDFDIENLDQWLRHDRRLRREYYSQELLNLRVVCREFCYVATPRVFRTLWLTHTLKSMEGFLAVMQSPWVSHCVQNVRYQYWNPDPHRYEKPSPDLIWERAGYAETRQMLCHTLSRLHEFPSLRSLSIRFGEIAPPAPELDRIRDDLSSILDGLLSLGASLSLSPSRRRPLESLYLTCWPPIHLAQYDHPAFGYLRAQLSVFEIHCAGSDAWSSLDVGPLPERLVSPCEPFFYDTMPHRILPPPSAATGLRNLEALSLCFSDPIGVFYISYSFSELYFPRLRALRMQHVQFSVARDAERFVTQHGETLLELHLLHLQVAVAAQDSNDDGQHQHEQTHGAATAGMNGDSGNVTETEDASAFNGWPPVPRPWSDIFTEFEKKLHRLVFLDMQDAWWISFPDKYITYSPGEMMQFLEEGREEDKHALTSFQETVAERARDSGTEYEPVFPLRDEDELICDCH